MSRKEDSIFADDDWLSGDSFSSKPSADHSISQELSDRFDDEDSLFNRPIKKAQSEEESENDTLASSVFEDSSATPSTSSTTSAYEEQDSRLAQTLKKNRKKYIKKLFKGSEEDYLDVLEKLESKSIWPKVVSCLQKEVIPDFEIDMTTKVMVQFTDELEKYFND